MFELLYTGGVYYSTKKTLYADLTFLVADAALLPFPAGLTVALSVLVLPPSTAQQRAHACTTAQHNNSIAIQQHSITTTYQFNSTALYIRSHCVTTAQLQHCHSIITATVVFWIRIRLDLPIRFGF
jgi:hypothetical protein